MPDPDPAPDGNVFGQSVCLALLTLSNAFFASTEMALVSLNRTRIQMLADEGSKKAKLLLRLIDDPSKFLSTIQIGITLGGFFASASAATGIADDFAKVLDLIRVPRSTQVAMVIVTIILSYFTLVFGELVPKRVALKNPEKLAMFTVVPVHWLSVAFSPFIWFLSFSVRMVLKLFGMGGEDDENTVTKEEIRALVAQSAAGGVINASERDMIDGVISLDTKRAEDVMIPRTSVYVIDAEEDVSQYLDEMMENNYSRVPVYEGSIDNVIGLLYMKDFVAQARVHGFDRVNVRDILRKPYFAPQSMGVNALFRHLQRTKNHIAIIVDEYGGFAGIVTMEDLIEEVVGDIFDEYDDDPVPEIPLRRETQGS